MCEIARAKNDGDFNANLHKKSLQLDPSRLRAGWAGRDIRFMRASRGKLETQST
jgi:hypothetical protein